MARPEVEELKTLGYNALVDSLAKRDGAARLLTDLPDRFKPEQIRLPTKEQRAWELCGLFYLNQGRFHEALGIFEGLYNHMLAWQDQTGQWSHKGMPLVWVSDCHTGMGHPALAKRYAMLTLIEDAISLKSHVDPENTGIYFRLVWHYGLPDLELKRYATEAYQLYQGSPDGARYPEWILQELDNNWMQEYPTAVEAAYYRASLRYVATLLGKLGDQTGRPLERLAEYLLSVIPGCRTYRRRVSGSTDYDVVCSLEGSAIDFRSELGRYFLCECKDWDSPADFTAIAKFCRVLDSVKCRFGILFSREGLSGEGKTRYGERELLKVFQDRGLVVVVISQQDLLELGKGASLIAMLRARYERVRLDLIED